MSELFEIRGSNVYYQKGHGAMLSKFPSVLIDLALRITLPPTVHTVGVRGVDSRKKKVLQARHSYDRETTPLTPLHEQLPMVYLGSINRTPPSRMVPEHLRPVLESFR